MLFQKQNKLLYFLSLILKNKCLDCKVIEPFSILSY